MLVNTIMTRRLVHFFQALGYFEKCLTAAKSVLNQHSPISPTTNTHLAIIQPIASDRVEKVEKGAERKP